MEEAMVRRVRGMPNLEFLERYARPGRVGLIGGVTPVDRGIRFAQRHVHPERRSSLWSHAFIFQGERIDGKVWVIESDLDIALGQLRNGVQENRIDKYADASVFPNLAALDFRLAEKQARTILAAALDLASRRTKYALGGALETYWAMVRKELRKGRMARDAAFCSSFVRSVFRKAGIDLAPGVAVRHTTPEHIFRTPAPHGRYVLVRDGA